MAGPNTSAEDTTRVHKAPRQTTPGTRRKEEKMSAKRRSAPTSVSAPNSDGLLPASGVPDPQELAGVLERIAACRQLPENWDGEDAFPVPEEAAARARG